MTWFDALLVTLWAVVTALGVRRGLAGLTWGVGGVLACFAANTLTSAPLLAAGVTLLLGLGVAVGTRHLIRSPVETPWHLAAGAVGGFLLGGVLIATLALGFPLDSRVTPTGRAATYPSTSLPPQVYAAVNGSMLKNYLLNVWRADSAVRTLLIPDQTRQP